MSETKHTPRPWTVGKYGTSVKKSDGFNIRLERSKGGGGGGREKEDERLKADALLIASAPELLKAAKEIVGIIDEGILNEGYVCDTFTAQPLRLAISKAEEGGKV